MNETVDAPNPAALASEQQAVPGPRPEDCGSRMGPRWYVVQTHPGAERMAIQELANQAFAAVTPMRLIKAPPPVPGAPRKHRRQDHDKLRPYCPGYVFVLFDMDAQPWRKVHHTRGVRRLFSYSEDRPIPVPVGAVERLMVEMSRSIAGVIPTVAAEAPIPPGVIVDILTPGFRGEKALILAESKPGQHRVQLLRNGYAMWLPRPDLKAPE
jgi:transcription antitermination factor NusG